MPRRLEKIFCSHRLRHTETAGFALLALSVIVGCAPGDVPLGDHVEAREDAVTYVGTRVFAWDDGSASLFAWPSHNSKPSVFHFPSGDEPSWTIYGAALSGSSPSYVSPDADAAHHDGALYTAFTKNSAVGSHYTQSVVRLARWTKGSGGPAWSDWTVHRSVSGEEPVIGPAKIAAAADGTIHVLYGTSEDAWSNTDDASTLATSRRGLQLATCTTLHTCTISQIVDDDEAHRARYALAVGSEGPVVTMTGETEVDTVHVYEPADDGSWQETEISVPGMGEVVPRVAAGAGRTVLAVNSKHRNGFALPARYTLLFEKSDTGWEELARLDELSVGNLDVRVGSAGVSVFGRRVVTTEASGAREPIGGVFYEADGFAPRELVGPHASWAARGEAALSPEGTVRHVVYLNSPATLTGALLNVTPTLHRWAEDEGRGAGSIAAKDPCLVEGTVVDLVGSEPKTIAAGSCVVVGDDFSGPLRIEGDPGSPVHVLGGTIESRDVDAKWTFFDGTVLASSGAHATFAIERSSLSLSRLGQEVSGPAVAAPATSGEAVRTTIRLEGSILGPYFDHAMRAEGAADVTISDTTFRDTFGPAVQVESLGDGDPLTLAIEACDFLRTRAALDADGALSDLPLTVIGTTVLAGDPEMPEASFDWVPADRGAAISVRGASGEIRDSVVRGSPRDGIRLDSVGLFLIGNSEISENQRHGIVVLGPVPAGLGPCEVEVNQDGPAAPAPAWDPDPIVRGCRIDDNGGSGIEVEYPSIPMQVFENRITGNAGEGFAIRKGRGVSPRGPDPACSTGFRRESEEDVPLWPETHVTANDLVGNGTDAENLQLSSDHRVGALPATDNYWGTTNAGEVSQAAACFATCEVVPFAASPIP